MNRSTPIRATQLTAQTWKSYAAYPKASLVESRFIAQFIFPIACSRNVHLIYNKNQIFYKHYVINSLRHNNELNRFTLIGLALSSHKRLLIVT